MNKTTSNLIGGFLGGFLGIIITGYFHPALLPLGVFVGVIFGYWSKTIAKLAVDSIKKVLSLHKSLNFLARKRVQQLKAFLKAIPEAFILFFKKVRKSFKFKLVFRRPKWMNKLFRRKVDPVTWSWVISILALVSVAALVALAMIYFVPWPETKTAGGGISGKPEYEVPFTLLDKVVYTGLVTLIVSMFAGIPLFSESDSESRQKAFYTRWERYSRYKAVSFFIVEVWRLIKSILLFGGLIAYSISYWVVIGGAIISFVTIPASIFVTFMIGLYEISKKSAHWLCFGVTLLVTSIMAIVYYGDFSNPATLWLVALSTGVVSGLATEGLRRLCLWLRSTDMAFKHYSMWYSENQVAGSVGVDVWRAVAKFWDESTTRIVARIV